MAVIDRAKAHDMLSALGIEIDSENGDEVLALCPMHEQRTGRADHNPSWWFNIESGAHLCFACGYKGNATTLVVDLLELRTSWGLPDLDAAEHWLENFSLDLVERVRRLPSRDTYEAEEAKRVPMSEARLAVYTDPPQWALDARRLSLDACKAYGIRFDEAEKTWITPLRNPDTLKLLGFQLKGEGHRLFKNLPPGMKKSTTLFGLDAFTGGRMIVVESPLDCARIHTAGFAGAVATCGAAVSEKQFDLMLRADQIVLALDNPAVDEAGAKSLQWFFDHARKRGIDFLQFSYKGTNAKDPGDMTKRQIARGIEHATHSIYGVDRLLDQL